MQSLMPTFAMRTCGPAWIATKDTTAAANVSGSWFLDRRGVACGRPAYGSYAVVDVPGQAGVPVRVNGAPAGATNRHGRVAELH